MITTQELSAIRERCDKATPGPWEYHAAGFNAQIGTARKFDGVVTSFSPRNGRISEDAAFIAPGTDETLARIKRGEGPVRK